MLIKYRHNISPTVTYTDHSYVICLSNKNIHIVKRRFIPHEPIKVWPAGKARAGKTADSSMQLTFQN